MSTPTPIVEENTTPSDSRKISLLDLEHMRLELEEKIKKLRADLTRSSLDATITSGPSSEPSSSSNTSSKTSTSSAASLEKLPDVLKNLVGSGLNAPDLAHVREQGRVFRTTCTSEMLEREQVTRELLPHVFNADPDKVAAFFAKSNVQIKMVLTKTCYREGYFSKGLNQFVCFRRWKHVSPLQAAALSLDNFLVCNLLSHIENDGVLRWQAAKQLQEVLNRKAVAEKIENLNNTWETAEAEADSSCYQAPFKNLIKAYSDYLTQFKTLFYANKLKKVDELWALVGECQRRLPTYGHQEFFDGRPFDPIPSFTTPPRRKCQYQSPIFMLGSWPGIFDSDLDLDELGLRAFFEDEQRFGLYKGSSPTTTIGQGDRVFGPSGILMGFVAKDSAAINRLCEIRQAELENIIDCLLKPGAAIVLRAEKNVRAKP